MKEFVDLKMVELKTEMAKEVEKIEKNYYVLHGKFDVILDVIAKMVEYNTSYLTKLDVKTEPHSQFISSIEANLKVELAPILELVLLLPTNAPPTKHVSQGERKDVEALDL
ncbi:unnamed protein product [Lactuca saligna]|uniref:Uncharacterized protein n=1 Tax=Lactuca saligna TaxID=75948 RepID=A0AA35YDB3_LACSI|nr:unnamed protein product [Lactuca saligna]